MSFICVEFLCHRHDPPCRFESLEYRPPPDRTTCPHCGALADRVISAPAGFAQFVTFERGAMAKPDNPRQLDTSGYGLRKQSFQEWRESTRQKHAEQRRKELKEKMR